MSRIAPRRLLATALAAALLGGCVESPPPTAPADRGLPPTTTLPAGDEVDIAEPWIRLPPAAAAVAAGYLRMHNTDGRDDRLLSARSAAATAVSLHETRMEDGMMRMRALEDGIAIPMGETVVLAPGGLHLMLEGLEGGIAAGDEVALTLVFEHAGERVVGFEVRDPAGQAGDADPHAGHAGH